VGRLVQGAPELRGNPKQARDCSYTRSSNPAQDNRIAEQRLNRAEIFALPFFAVIVYLVLTFAPLQLWPT
jgi:hypothetical protein